MSCLHFTDFTPIDNQKKKQEQNSCQISVDKQMHTEQDQGEEIVKKAAH